MTEYIRPHWTATATAPPPLRPGDVVRYADLDGVDFTSADLRGVAFFGCGLNGASFAGARLDGGTRLVGCFASATGAPVRFGRLPALVRSHLAGLSSGWPDPVADGARLALSGNNIERVHAVREIGAAGFAGVAPFLARLLDDPEWDVRATAVQALAALRGDDGFPDDDTAVLAAAFEVLGDDNSIPRMWATELVEVTGAPREVLGRVMALIGERDPGRVLTGLRAVAAMSGIGLPGAVEAVGGIDPVKLAGLIGSPVAAVRAGCLDALGALDAYVPEAWERGLRDGDPGVRCRAVITLRFLGDPPPASTVEPVLRDPDEGVRIEALFTLGHVGGFDSHAVRRLYADASEQVRAYARRLLGE